jgi:hypothetical protein
MITNKIAMSIPIPNITKSWGVNNDPKKINSPSGKLNMKEGFPSIFIKGRATNNKR